MAGTYIIILVITGIILKLYFNSELMLIRALDLNSIYLNIMKKKMFLGMFALLAISLTFGQKLKENEVPVNVRVTFKKHYPAVKAEKWEKEGANYEVSFDLNKVDYSVLIDENGAILETEVEIKVSELPALAIEYMAKHYAGQKVKEAAKITAADGTVTYEAEIKGEDLIFNSEGTFIKVSKD